MLVMLIPDDVPKGKEERYVVLTVQPRIPAGSLEFVEIPAGMVDNGTRTFAGTAANEIKEELHFTIEEKDLVNMSELVDIPDDTSESLPKGVYPSVGGCDEYIPIFAYEKVVPRQTLEEWNGKYTGLREEGENITLKIVRMEELWRVGCRDGKALAALALWENLRREKKIKSVLDPELQGQK
jgi:ADP-sugar diphosphatase